MYIYIALFLSGVYKRLIKHIIYQVYPYIVYVIIYLNTYMWFENHKMCYNNIFWLLKNQTNIYNSI